MVEEHVRQGDQALAEGRHAQALSAYGHARELAPASARVQRAQMWARVHLMADDPARVAPESLDDMAYEAELLRASAQGDRAREAVCLVALGNVRARRGDVEGARAKLEEAVRVDPASAIAHAALGWLLLDRRETADMAKASFEKALAIDAGSARALLGLGQLQIAAGDAAGAAARFEAVLARRDDASACLGLGNARLQQGRHADAAPAFQRALALDPRSAEALSGLGQALLGAGKLDEAERALRAASAMRQEQGTSIALGYTLARLRRSDEALSVFGQVLASDPGAAPALYGAGTAAEDLGRAEQALDFYRRLLTLSPEGSQKPLVVELQKQAQGRVAALSVSPAASSSSSAPAGPAPAAPPAPAPRDVTGPPR